MRAITLIGSGESLHFCDWEKIPGRVGVLSGAINHFQYKHVDHFFALDGPMFFPDWVKTSERFQKHVINADYWEDVPNATLYDIDETDHGCNFSTEGKICNGPLMDRRHTLLFAVQVLLRLGYDRVTFVGVDLISGHQSINSIMEQWYGRALEQGIKWYNASPLSALQAWMPDAPVQERITA